MFNSRIDFNVRAIPVDIISAIQQTAEATYQNAMQMQMQPSNPNQNPVQMQQAGGNQ